MTTLAAALNPQRRAVEEDQQTKEHRMSKCIEWPGAKDRKGYGYVSIGGQMRRAHRVALAKRLGRELLRSEWALHSCHNPSCVNADHLRIGDAAENNREARARRSTLAKRVLGVDGDAS